MPIPLRECLAPLFECGSPRCEQMFLPRSGGASLGITFEPEFVRLKQIGGWDEASQPMWVLPKREAEKGPQQECEVSW